MRAPLGLALALACGMTLAAQSQPVPSTPLHYGMLSATFAADGTFTLGGGGWPTLTGGVMYVRGATTLFAIGRPAR